MLPSRRVLFGCIALVVVAVYHRFQPSAASFADDCPFREEGHAFAASSAGRGAAASVATTYPLVKLRPGEPAALNETFRTRLLPDKRYITSFGFWGFNNQILSSINLLHLADYLHSVGTPVIPILSAISNQPGHVQGAIEPFPFGEVFDLARFEREKGWGCVEWGDLKNPETGMARGGARGRGEEQREGWAKEGEWVGAWKAHLGPDVGSAELMNYYGLQPAWTPLPQFIYGSAPEAVEWSQIYLPLLDSFMFPDNNAQKVAWVDRLSKIAVEQNWGPLIDKEDWRPPAGGLGDVMFFDFLFYMRHFNGKYTQPLPSFVASDNSTRDALDSPWETVGRYLHWPAPLRQIGQSAIRATLGLSENADIPPLITVHMRRGDFLAVMQVWCSPPDVCPYEWDLYLNAAERLKISEGAKRHIDPALFKVIVTTNFANHDPEFDAFAKKNGWFAVDHDLLQTRERHGPWHVPLLDQVILSQGFGFVGTVASSMSWLALRRVETWNEGESVMVTPVKGWHD